jgi:predicted outer membrane repeat protein
MLTEVSGVANAATSDGGFAYVDNVVPFPEIPAVTLDIVVGTFTGNSAGADGGALRLIDATGTADAATRFEGNTAGVDGGAVAVFGANDTKIGWTGGTFVGNAADGDGGGIHVWADLEVFDLEISAVVVDANSAGSRGGGMALQTDLVVLGRTIAILDTTMTNNTAFEGGGLALLSAHALVEDSVLMNNVAARGGGAWIDPEAVLDVTSTDFIDNERVDIAFSTGETYDAPDRAATFTCSGADAICR